MVWAGLPAKYQLYGQPELPGRQPGLVPQRQTGQQLDGHQIPAAGKNLKTKKFMSEKYQNNYFFSLKKVI